MVKVVYEMRELLEENGFTQTTNHMDLYRREHENRVEFIDMRGMKISRYAMSDGMGISPTDDCDEVVEKLKEVYKEEVVNDG